MWDQLCCSAIKRAAFPICWRKEGWLVSNCKASVKASTSSELDKTIPDSGVTKSAAPVEVAVITGKPEAIASITTKPKGS